MISDFLNLNVDAKRDFIHKMFETLNLLVSAIYLNHPQLHYTRGLLEITRELAELMFLNDDTHFPIIRANGDFMKILNKYNELQKKEELFMKTTREHNLNLSE